jgi:hypothetical protein
MGGRHCFVISPIGAEGSAVRRHADDVYLHLIKPAVERFPAVDAMRGDEVTEPGRITDQMFREILRADFCIALLTGHNPNVFYEVAVAQAAGKPVIFLGAADEEMPFDIQDMRSLRYPRDESRSNEGYVAQLASFIASLQRQGWKGESLFERYGARAPVLLPATYAFEPLASEVQGTLDRLADGTRLHEYVNDGDAQRLFDGVYASILYASRAAIAGRVEASLYGNLMELDAAGKRLRVRYFAGPYNDEVATRSFPLAGRGEGVASTAFATQKVQVVNSMAQELKVRGEARLSAMVCVPVPGCDPSVQSRQVVLLNIDAGVPDAFPAPQALHDHPAGSRLEQLAGLLAQTNALYRWIIERAPRAPVPGIAPGALLPPR